MKFHILRAATVLLSLLVTAAAQVTGSGTTNFLPKWTGGTSLGNSALFQSGGQIGIGTTSPVARLTVIGLNGTIGINGGNAPKPLQVTGGFGVTNLSGFGVQGAGGPIQIVSGTGAPLPGSLALGGTGAAILMTTHVMDEADRCDTVALLRDGTILARGTPDDLKRETGMPTLEGCFLHYGGVR